MRRPAMVLALLVLAACADRTPRPAEPAVTVGFATQAPPGAAAAIEVRAVNPRPLTAAALVGPGGPVAVAQTIERDLPAASPGYGVGPDVGVGVYGGSSSGIGTGVFLGFPIGGYGVPRPADAGRTRSRAVIPIADMAAYRQTWERTQVRLRFGSDELAEIVEIPAPAPGTR